MHSTELDLWMFAPYLAAGLVLFTVATALELIDKRKRK